MKPYCILLLLTFLWRTMCEYAGTVTHHNVCKRHSFLDIGFKQTEHAIFLHVIPMR